jgi:succinate-semialdehyde dehydrogenase/glutarate-semialdehyde dehydrogenase
VAEQAAAVARKVTVSIYAVVDPATGKTLSEYPSLTDTELTEKLDLAAAAHRTWGRTSSPAQRAALLRKAGALFAERREELATIISREMGKPVSQGVLEVDFAAAIFEYYADLAETFLADEPVPLAWGEGSAVVRRQALGVLLGVMPWNYPYYQVARFAAPNLMVGNTILLKHSSQCPESAAALEALFLDAGFPGGAYVNLYASYAQVDTIVADPRVQGISVTGSERAGARIAEVAGRHLKKVVLELGGADPFIVLSTEDLDATVECAMTRFYDNSGQACSGAKRFIIIDDLYDAFLAKLTAALSDLRPGDPSAADTVMGPLSSEAAAAGLEHQLHRAVEHGARVAHGGSRDGCFFEPTILVDIARDNPVGQEELFGPFANIYRAPSEDRAIELANDTPFGLGSYLFTTDPDQAQRVANQIDAGMVFVNLIGAEEPGLPFGGTKRSGHGRELGRYGAEEFVNHKVIRIAP